MVGAMVITVTTTMVDQDPMTPPGEVTVSSLMFFMIFPDPSPATLDVSLLRSREMLLWRRTWSPALWMR